MAKQINTSNTLTFIPSSFDETNSTYKSIYNNNNPSNGLTDHNSSTRLCAYANTGSGAESIAFYNFDCSSIPAGATIDSVSCIAAASCYSSGQYFSTRQLQLYIGTTTPKGSPTTITGNGSTKANHTLTCGSSWTRAELDNLKLRIYITRTTSNTTTDASFSFWGATLSITYTISGTAYELVATSNVSGVTASPATQDILAGEDAEIRIDATSLENVTVTDNGVDVTSALIQHVIPSGGTADTVLGTYNLVSGTFNSSSSSYFSGIVGNGVNANKTTSNYYSSSSGTIVVFTYNLTFSNIPSNATITRLYCEINGHAESTSNNNEYMCAALALGSSDSDLISTELNFKSIGTSNSTQTIEATTLPTVAQLSNLKLRCRLGYYGGAINGATCYLVYTVPGSGGYYWTYALTNLNDDHIVLIDTAGVYIPPEEDPQYIYQSLTISSINATTNPSTGTTRIVQGSNQTITISPTDSQLTLALDNGVDITSQLVGGTPTNTYTVTTQVSGASYGFSLNSSTGYYVSTNNGQSSSASVCRVNFDLESDVLVTIQYINQGESQADYGMFGKIDTTVSTTGTTYSSSSASPDDPDNYYYMCASASDSSTSTKTLTYNISAGQHYIDIKYGKDQASDSGNDSLQWKILSVEATSAGGDYTYTLNNITQDHSLIFVFGSVNYYFITSSGTNCRLFPDGQMVKLEGDNYQLTIVPNNITDTVTLTDNGTSQILERFDGVDKDNNPAVSYRYQITNVQVAHTLVVTSTGATVTDSLFLKINGSWVDVVKVYVKENNVWVEKRLSYLSDNNIDYLKQGT